MAGKEGKYFTLLAFGLLMEAIYRSAREKRAITLPPVAKRDVFRGPEPKTKSEG